MVAYQTDLVGIIGRCSHTAPSSLHHKGDDILSPLSEQPWRTKVRYRLTEVKNTLESEYPRPSVSSFTDEGGRYELTEGWLEATVLAS